MKHNIKINGEVKEIDCLLGSGRFDSNGKEIFEGDIVKVVFDDDDKDAGLVVFEHGAFRALDEDLADLLYGCEVTVID